jgi:sulfatase maturation enzyme AslB (radical SAM superfamily)
MSEETAKQSVDFMFREAGPNKVVHMTLFGGETLLNFPVLKIAIPYARKRASEVGKRVEFNLTTNATLLSPEIIDFLIEKCNVENMTLEIITNATKKLQSTLVDKLNRFKKIRLIGSIDGCNAYNSYQRWGSPGFDGTLTIYKEYIDQLNNVHKGHIHSTYTTLNLNGFADDMDYWATNYPNWSVSFKFVEDSEYSPYNGPDWYNDWILSEWKTNTENLEAPVP